MRGARLVAALVLAFAAASAHAEIISLAARPPEAFGDYLRVALLAHGRYISRGDAAKPEAIYDVEAVLWRPVKSGGTLLVETEPEPANALAANAADVRQIARRRGMTILFAAPSLNKMPDAVRPAVLRDLVAHLRKSEGAAHVIARGAGAEAVFLKSVAADGGGFDGLLLHDGGAGVAPSKTKVIETYGSDAFWRAEPKPLDAEPEPPNLRRFFIAGTASSTLSTNCALPLNTQSSEPALRALLAALDDWVAKGAAPPASRVPRIKDHTLAPARDLRWPKLLRGPDAVKNDRLAPALDADGNETSGLRLPDQALPLATHAGWNPRKDIAGPPCAAGSSQPFPISKAEREKTGDPRLSLAERYGSRAYFVATMRVVADKLVKERLLLQGDADAYVARAKTAPF